MASRALVWGPKCAPSFVSKKQGQTCRRGAVSFSPMAMWEAPSSGPRHWGEGGAGQGTCLQNTW